MGGDTDAYYSPSFNNQLISPSQKENINSFSFINKKIPDTRFGENNNYSRKTEGFVNNKADENYHSFGYTANNRLNNYSADNRFRFISNTSMHENPFDQNRMENKQNNNYDYSRRVGLSS